MAASQPGNMKKQPLTYEPKNCQVTQVRISKCSVLEVLDPVSYSVTNNMSFHFFCPLRI